MQTVLSNTMPLYDSVHFFNNQIKLQLQMN